MKAFLKNKMSVAMAAAMLLSLSFSPDKISEQSFLFPELTAFPSIELDEEKSDEALKPRIFIFDFLREIFCTDKD